MNRNLTGLNLNTAITVTSSSERQERQLLYHPRAPGLQFTEGLLLIYLSSILCLSLNQVGLCECIVIYNNILTFKCIIKQVGRRCFRPVDRMVIDSRSFPLLSHSFSLLISLLPCVLSSVLIHLSPLPTKHMQTHLLVPSKASAQSKQ